MITSIGCDIVEHKTTKKLKWDIKNSVQNRIFSQAELENYSKQQKISFLSGRFAAKEAVLKCLGTGMQDGIDLTDIEILQNLDGKPIVKLKGQAKIISDTMGIVNWHISITHTDNYSIAFVVAEKKQ